MAIEYVDATKLDNSLAYTANRIRAKTGGSSALNFDLANETGFGNDVDAIPSGGGGSRLPAEYQEVEYIENDGTAAVTTLHKVNVDYSKVIVEASFSRVRTVSSILLGVYDTSANWFGLRSNGLVGLASDALFQNVTYYDKKTYEVSWVYNTATAVCGNETISKTGSVNTTNKIRLFNAPSGNYWAYAKIYSYKHYLDVALLEDLVPCYRISDGVIGFYDLISETFLVNDGSGTLKKGSDVLSAQQALNILLGGAT